MRVASFDIGSKNFAFVIEQFRPESYHDIVATLSKPKKSTYQAWAESPGYQEALHDVFLEGKVLRSKVVDLTEGRYANDAPEVFINMWKLMGRYLPLFDDCDIVLIEEQLQWVTRNNIAVKLAQHCISFFLFHYGTFKTVWEYPAYYKYRVLGAPWKMPKYQRKKWAGQLGEQIGHERKDRRYLASVARAPKADDVADCLLQLQSFKMLRELPPGFFCTKQPTKKRRRKTRKAPYPDLRGIISL